MSVGVGSEADPSDFIGFTHLIEHLLFTGSVNFPSEHQIEKIIEKFNGDRNGVTKGFLTSYFFQLKSEGINEFFPALADAIANPLFSEENILKEINNVNSEISMRMTFNKNLAYYKLLKKIGNPKSKIFSDGFGNIDVKNINIKETRKRIVDFHNARYSANLMSLVVISDLPLIEVRRQVEEHFNVIPNKDLPRLFFNETIGYEEPILPITLGQIYYLKAFTEPTKFTMVFVLPSDKINTEFDSIELFSLFLNYKSQNSIKEKLIKEDLITEIEDTIAFHDYVTALYVVSFKLTKKGRENVTLIQNHFFRFIKNIKQNPIKEQIYNDLAKTSKFAFLFNIKSPFIDFGRIGNNMFDRALQFSENLLNYPPMEMFSAQSLFTKYNDTDFSNTLSLINPLNSIFMIEDTQFKEGKIKGRRMYLKPKMAGPILMKRTKIRKMKMLSHGQSVFDKEGMILPTEVKNAERILGSQETESSPVTLVNPEPNKSLAWYFNGASEHVLLDDRLDNDNNRGYTMEKVPTKLLVDLDKGIESFEQNYETCSTFSTEHFDYYSTVTTCQIPETLTKGYNLNDTNTDISTISIVEDRDHRNALYTKNVFATIFNDQEPKLDQDKQLIYLRDLLSFKLCLIKEAVNDDKNDQANQVYKDTRLSVYHALYRKTLQPKCIIDIEIDSEKVMAQIPSLNYQEKLELQLKMELWCYYMKKNAELRFHEEYMKGNSLKCRFDSFRILLTFEGINSQIENFIIIIMNNILSLTNSAAYEPYILENIKQRVIESYSQFNSITSINLSQFYLNLIIDKMAIDNSSEEKLEKIKGIVNGITPENVSLVLLDFLSSNNVIVLGVGNIEEAKVVELAKKSRGLLKIGSKNFEGEVNFLKYRNFIHQNFITSVNYDEHVMLRLENINKEESNNAYITFFQIHKVNRSHKLQSKIFNHFLSKIVYDELRNKLNLGYVAQSGLKILYHVN